MPKCYLKLVTSILLFLFCSENILARDVADILLKPEKSDIVPGSPLFIWEDYYRDGKTRNSETFKLTIYSQNSNKSLMKIFNPLKLYDSVYYYQLPGSLDNGQYNYSIDYLENNKASKRRYTAYLRYPIRGYFTVDKKKAKVFNKNIPAENQVKYLYLSHNNKIENGYNSLFFASAGTGALGLGLLFYKVLNFNKITRIFSYICFASSAAGYSASLYYSGKYYYKKNQLEKLIEINSISINYGISPNNIITAISLAY